jgi:hypothetical protein
MARGARGDARRAPLAVKVGQPTVEADDVNGVQTTASTRLLLLAYLGFAAAVVPLIYFLGGTNKVITELGPPAWALSFAFGAVTRRKAVGLPMIVFLLTFLWYGAVFEEAWRLQNDDLGPYVLVGHAFIWLIAIPAILAGVYVGKRMPRPA